MRRTLLVVHRWVALVTGIVLIGTAGSGAILVFEAEIDRALHPALWNVTPARTPLPIDSLVAAVEAHFPGETVTGITLAPVPDRAWIMPVGTNTVFVNPYTGAINGVRTLAESQATLARRLHVFHVEFFAGPAGRNFVTIVTAIALFLVLTGIYLWWPDKTLRVRTSASWKRITFDLHHALGVLASLVLIVITSSAMLVHSEGLSSAVRSLDSEPQPAPPSQPPGPASAPRPSFDAIAAAARSALPGANVMFILLGGPKNPVVVATRYPEDRTPGGRSRVYVDRFSNAVLGKTSTREAGLGSRIDNLKRSLHTGDVLGWPTRILWLLASLVMVSQMVTGTLMWWNARRARGAEA